MQISEFKNQISTAGLSRSYNWVCRVFPPRALTTITNQMQVNTNANQGGNRVNVNLPGVQVGMDFPINFPVGDIGTVGLNVGTINLGTPNRGFTLSNVGGVLESLNLYCMSCSIPSRDLQNIEWTDYGERRALGNRHRHTDFGVKYYCSENLFERFFFEQWQEIVFNSNTKRFGYYDDYVSTIEILKYNASWSNVEALYRLEEAYPSNVGALQLNHADNSILQLDISFKYRKFTRLPPPNVGNDNLFNINL
jgi:hypothetical protein